MIHWLMKGDHLLIIVFAICVLALMGLVLYEVTIRSKK